MPVLRVALFWAAFWLLLFGLRNSAAPVAPELGNLLAGGIGTLGAVLLIKALLKSESTTFADIGLIWEAGSARRFVLGSLVGMVVVGIMLVVIVALSGLAVEPMPNPDYGNAIGLRTAIYVTSFFFALYHGLHPSQLLGPGVWGIFFGLAAVVSRGLALPLGLHFGLNWMQSLFGMKTQLASPLWTIVPGTGDGMVSSDVVGLALQLVLLVSGVVLVELHVRKHPDGLPSLP